MPPLSLFCFGYGYTAEALGQRLAQHGTSIAGTTTTADKANTMSQSGIRAHIWHGEALNDAWLDDADAILVSIPPGKDGCPVFHAAQKIIAARCSQWRWIGYLSTNGVYGDHNGAWVNEESQLQATSDRAKRRIIAENQWLGLAVKFDLPVTVFRLPGIYGPGRSALETVLQGKAKRIVKEGQVFNRMHIDDIVTVLTTTLGQPRLHDIYNLADDDPAPPQDVIEYACAILDLPPPPLVPIEQADLSAMAQSFYADNKRVSNRRMKNALDIALRYPSYRDGLKAIADAMPGNNHGSKQ